MAGAACKVIINMFIRALTNALEVILTNPSIHLGKIPDAARLKLIQRLADVDLSVYEGDTDLMPEGGLTGIIFELQRYGLVTDEVWQVLHRPEALGSKTHMGTEKE